MKTQSKRVPRDKGVSEVFGYPADASEPEVVKARSTHFCPYLESRCEKVSQHRSMPADLPFGACSVLYWSEEQQASVPHVICPYRFVESGTIFKDAQRLFGPPVEGAEIFLIPEIDLPVGRLDYILAVREGVDIKRFLVLEVMAISTTQTGAVIRSFLDTLQGREKTQTYNYGINWRQVVSRMVVQMLAKAHACAEWNVPMVWVVQDVFYNYIVRETKIELKPVPLRKVYNKPPHPILFFVYRVVPDAKENRNSLQLAEMRGGTQKDFEKMLQPGRIPDVAEVAAQIQSRIQNGKAFNLNLEPVPKLGKAVPKIIEGEQNSSA